MFLEYVIQEGLPPGEMLGPGNYMDFWTFESLCPACTKVASNVPQISVDEVVYGNDLTENGRSQKLLSEQKSAGLVRHLVPKFSKSNDFVLGAFVGTSSTAKPCQF